MNESIFLEITRIIKEIHKDGMLISSVAEEVPYEKDGLVLSQTIIRVVYGTSSLDSVTRERLDGPSYHGSVKDKAIVIKLYHIDDFIRFISEGDIAFYNFLYNNPDKQSEMISQYEYCIHAFDFFKVNREIFISKLLIESTISQAWSFFEDALSLISNDTKKDTINANILLAQGIYDILRVIEMEFDGVDEWSLEFPYKNQKTFRTVSAIANGYVPWSELLNFYKNKINELEGMFKNNINIKDKIDDNLMNDVINHFYVEYLSRKIS